MSSIKCVIIDKNATLSCSVIKNVKEDELYKKCGYKSDKGFKNLITWEVEKNDEQCYISLFGKEEGRANSENKYDLPPPVDKDLYYGTLLLVKHCYQELTNETVEDFKLEEWNKLYEKLFGGFEDLGEEDSYSEEEEIPEHLQTKQGYSKEDGFVVSDDDVEDDDYVPNEEEEEAHSSTDDADDAEEEDGMGHDSEIDDDDEEEEEDYDDEEEYDSDELGSELSEESYVDSD